MMQCMPIVVPCRFQTDRQICPVRLTPHAHPVWSVKFPLKAGKLFKVSLLRENDIFVLGSGVSEAPKVCEKLKVP